MRCPPTTTRDTPVVRHPRQPLDERKLHPGVRQQPPSCPSPGRSTISPPKSVPRPSATPMRRWTPSYYSIKLARYGGTKAEVTSTLRAGHPPLHLPRRRKGNRRHRAQTSSCTRASWRSVRTAPSPATNPVRRVYQGNGELAGFKRLTLSSSSSGRPSRPVHGADRRPRPAPRSKRADAQEWAHTPPSPRPASLFWLR